MNYTVFENLCKEKGTNPTALSLKLGLSKGNTTSWKKGGNPSVEVLMQIADELNCTTDYLLTGKEKSPSMELSEDELQLLEMYDLLTEREKGIIIGEMRTMTREHAESKNAETA